VEQFKLYTGKDAPYGVMREGVRFWLKSDRR